VTGSRSRVTPATEKKDTHTKPCREAVCPRDTLHRSYAPFSSGLTKGGFVCSYVPASVWIRPDACGAASCGPGIAHARLSPACTLPIPSALLELPAAGGLIRAAITAMMASAAPVRGSADSIAASLDDSSYLFIVLPEGGVLRPPVRPLAAALKTPSAFRPPALALFSSCTDKARGGSSPIAGPC